MDEVRKMKDLDSYTPEMLVYYHSLSPGLQKAVRNCSQPISSLESLARAAELCAQSGLAPDNEL